MYLLSLVHMPSLKLITIKLLRQIDKLNLYALSVIEASNGLQAWKLLEDLTNHVDLVLTEVVMPCLSGVGLLSKIMNHQTRKNLPVISKFLLCPFVILRIRKNVL